MKEEKRETARERAVGENVSYGNEGVFTVVDIRTERVAGTSAEYYVLKRYGDIGASLVLVPKNNEALVSSMRDLMSADEARALLLRAPSIKAEEISDDPRDRVESYKKMIEGGHESRIALLKTAAIWMEKRREEGKKPYLNDETAYKKAEKLLYSEIGATLGMPEDEIRKAILG